MCKTNIGRSRGVRMLEIHIDADRDKYRLRERKSELQRMCVVSLR